MIRTIKLILVFTLSLLIILITGSSIKETLYVDVANMKTAEEMAAEMLDLDVEEEKIVFDPEVGDFLNYYGKYNIVELTQTVKILAEGMRESGINAVGIDTSRNSVVVITENIIAHTGQATPELEKYIRERISISYDHIIIKEGGPVSSDTVDSLYLPPNY